MCVFAALVAMCVRDVCLCIWECVFSARVHYCMCFFFVLYLLLCVFDYECMFVFVCVGVWVGVWGGVHTHSCVCMHHVCVYVCVYVCGVHVYCLLVAYPGNMVTCYHG